MTQEVQPKRKRQVSDLVSSEGSLVLSLSLFVILLAFFIVLNGLSNYSEPKVGQAIESLENAFAQSIINAPADKSSMDDRQGDSEGQGDSIRELQGVLKSLLPNLNLQANPNPNGGSVMAVRMEKGQFERLSNNLMPLFIRILNEKNSDFSYGLTLTSYVRDPSAPNALKSFNVVDAYRQRMVDGGLSQSRLGIDIENGNPAIIMFTFESLPKGVE